MSEAAGHLAETIHLSESANDLLRRRLTGERVEATDETRPYDRELAVAGLMMPRSIRQHGFRSGDQGQLVILVLTLRHFVSDDRLDARPESGATP